MNTKSLLGLLGVIVLVVLGGSFKKFKSPKKSVDDWDPMLGYEGYNPPPTTYLDKDGKRCC